MIRANPDHFRTIEEPIYEISKIVDHKLESGLLKYYVQWLHSDHVHSWELESDLALPCAQHIEHYWRLNPGNPRPLTKVGQHTDIDRRPTRRETATVTPDEFALRKSARLQEKSQAREGGIVTDNDPHTASPRGGDDFPEVGEES